MLQLPSASFVRLDLFPAALSTFSEEMAGKDYRIIITDSYLLVFGDTNTGPDLIHQLTLEEYFGKNTQTHTWTVDTVEDGLVEISRVKSCGCGSRLRGTNIYPAVRRIYK